jgi:hypothetical protein
MIFTPDHCRILASCGTKTDIEFYYCEFQDEGATFVAASAARQDKTAGPAKLRIHGNLIFNDRNLTLFLSQHKLESLGLWYYNLGREVSCRAVATAQVRCLTLEGCILGDDGEALVEAVKQRRSPQELCFIHDHPFRSNESFVSFINALRGDDHLERLYLHRRYPGNASTRCCA